MIRGRSGRTAPFDMTGVVRTDDGVLHPDVFEAAVLGVPDEMMGEKVGAVVVPVPGTEPDPQEIRAFVKERIADYNAPQYVSLRTEPLPRNPAGKVLKPLLRNETRWAEELR